MKSHNAIHALVLAAYVLVFIILLMASPAYTFYTGDQGLKFIQIRTIEDHGPLHLHLPEKGIPADALEHALPDAATYTYEGKTYSIYSPLFALLTAPFHLALGYPGLFLLPFLCALGCCLLGRRLASRLFGETRCGLYALLLILASPIAFYGMVFWEHAPAVFFCGIALYLFMLRGTKKALFFAGLAIGAACWFRPESLLFGVVMGLAGLYLRMRPDTCDPPARGVRITILSLTAYAAGTLAGYLPQLLVNIETSGTILGGSLLHHLPRMSESWTSTDAKGAVMANTTYWNQAWNHLVRPRIAFVYRYFLGDLWPTITACILLALTGRLFMRGATNPIREKLTSLLLLIFVAGAVAYPVLRYLAGGASIPFWNFWLTFPASAGVLGILCVSRPRDGRLRFLLLLGTGTILLKIFVMPVGGGVQWGLRMMLPAFLPLALAVAFEMRRGETKLYRHALLLLLAASLSIQCVGAAKIASHRQKLAVVPGRLSGLTESGEVILSPCAPLYQICPVLTADRSFLQIPGGRNIEPLLDALGTKTPVSVVGLESEWPVIENGKYHLSDERVGLGWGGLEFRRIEIR
jgi:hypothetical protein